MLHKSFNRSVALNASATIIATALIINSAISFNRSVALNASATIIATALIINSAISFNRSVALNASATCEAFKPKALSVTFQSLGRAQCLCHMSRILGRAGQQPVSIARSRSMPLPPH